MDPQIHWLLPRKTPLWIGVLAVAVLALMPLVIGLASPASLSDMSDCAVYTMEVVLWGVSALCLVIVLPLIPSLCRIAVTMETGRAEERFEQWLRGQPACQETAEHGGGEESGV